MNKNVRDAIPKRKSELLPLHESAGHLIKIAHRLYQRLLAQELAQMNIRVSHWHFLRYLWEEDGITQRQLSRSIVIKESTAVAVVREMEGAGLIKRVRGKQDKRKVFIHLTPKAKRQMERLLPLAHAVNVCGIEGIAKKDMQVFLGVTRKIIENLESTLGESGHIGQASIGVPWE